MAFCSLPTSAQCTGGPRSLGPSASEGSALAPNSDQKKGSPSPVNFTPVSIPTARWLLASYSNSSHGGFLICKVGVHTVLA